MKNKSILIICLLAITILFFGNKNFSNAQSNNNQDPNIFSNETNSLDSNDVIGIRIIPNPEHYSINNWYKNQGFTGSPQNLIVDGYEAIRDGRTVYVNAANLKESANEKNIYTNIYLISYNQDYSTKTVDILGQIVKNWRFNTDLKEEIAPAPTCSISSKACLTDADCGLDQFCAPENSFFANSCQLKQEVNCLFDSDCPNNFYCDSIKSKIIRDVKRMGIAADLSQALQKYKTIFNNYPSLSAGSYLVGRTTSVWPSWSENFLNLLGLSESTIDPINRLGFCPDGNPTTCWNESNSTFYRAKNLIGADFVFPVNSYAFAYKSSGLDYDLCANFETTSKSDNLNYKFSPSISNLSNCEIDDAPNTAPIYNKSELSGAAGQEFIGWIEFSDAQNNPLTWDMSLTGPAWSGENQWPSLPVLQKTGNSNQVKIVSPLAGNPGVYPINIRVGDGRAFTSKNLDITLGNNAPIIDATNYSFALNPLKTFHYTFYFSDENILDYQSALKISRQAGTNHQFDPLSGLPQNFTKTIKPVGSNRYQVDIVHRIPTTYQFPDSLEYVYSLEVSDRYNNKTEKHIKINLINEKPVLNFECSGQTRLGKSFSCFLGPILQGGDSQQQITYSGDYNYFDLNLVSNDLSNVFLSAAKTSGLPGDQKNITIKATNQYGAFSTKSFPLKVNSYCGDGIRQFPNTEKRGGPNNDGFELCDGQDGVAKTAVESSLGKQYSCVTKTDDTPLNITNNNYCIFENPVDGGGYCGDGICQFDYENGANCSLDCAHTCQPDCSLKTCGDDGCGGSCGVCEEGAECQNGLCPTKKLAEISLFLFENYQILNESPFVYLNNEKINLTSKGNGFYTAIKPVYPGKNVLALPMTINSLEAGVNVTLSYDGKNYITPENLANGKCANSVSSDNWYTVDFNDDDWSYPNIGVYNGRAAVWARDYSFTHQNDYEESRLRSAYCRYTFDISFPLESCLVEAEGKNCGSTDCFGYFRPDNCIAINNGNENYICSNNVCTCREVDCLTNVPIGGDCGFVESRCQSGEYFCANQCAPGLVCDKESFTCKDQRFDDITEMD